MVKRVLSETEREIRQSRGISLHRLIPFALPIAVLIAIRLDQQFMQQCFSRVVGSEQGPINGMFGALVRNFEVGRLALAIECAPSYLLDYSHHGIAIATLALAAAWGVHSYFWLKRHKEYWSAVRQKEKADRAAKRKKTADNGSG